MKHEARVIPMRSSPVRVDVVAIGQQWPASQYVALYSRQPQRVSLWWPRLHGTSASHQAQHITNFLRNKGSKMPLDNCLCQLPPTTHSGETHVARACKAIGQFCPANNNFTFSMVRFWWSKSDFHFDRSRGGFSKVSLILQVPTMTGAAVAPTH